jgi:hypothetical protein
MRLDVPEPFDEIQAINCELLALGLLLNTAHDGRYIIYITISSNA